MEQVCQVWREIAQKGLCVCVGGCEVGGNESVVGSVTNITYTREPQVSFCEWECDRIQLQVRTLQWLPLEVMKSRPLMQTSQVFSLISHCLCRNSALHNPLDNPTGLFPLLLPLPLPSSPLPPIPQTSCPLWDSGHAVPSACLPFPCLFSVWRILCPLPLRAQASITALSRAGLSIIRCKCLSF